MIHRIRNRQTACLTCRKQPTKAPTDDFSSRHPAGELLPVHGHLVLELGLVVLSGRSVGLNDPPRPAKSMESIKRRDW